MFARILRSAIIEEGNRSEIVGSVGFRSGSLRRFAVFQSMNSVESCVAQNLRSSSSDLNSGICFFVPGISIPFFSAHIANRDYPDQIAPDGKGDEQIPASRRLAQGVKPFLLPRMTNLTPDYQGLIEEQVLGFFQCDPVPLPILANVRFVPIKSGAFAERVPRFRHDSSTL